MSSGKESRKHIPLGIPQHPGWKQKVHSKELNWRVCDDRAVGRIKGNSQGRCNTQMPISAGSLRQAAQLLVPRGRRTMENSLFDRTGAVRREDHAPGERAARWGRGWDRDAATGGGTGVQPCSRTAVTKYHKLGGFKQQQFILL